MITAEFIFLILLLRAVSRYVDVAVQHDRVMLGPNAYSNFDTWVSVFHDIIINQISPNTQEILDFFLSQFPSDFLTWIRRSKVDLLGTVYLYWNDEYLLVLPHTHHQQINKQSAHHLLSGSCFLLIFTNNINWGKTEQLVDLLLSTNRDLKALPLLIYNTLSYYYYLLTYYFN